LGESEDRLRNIILSNADWECVYTNSSQKGFELLPPFGKEIIGKTPFDFMLPEEAKRIGAIFIEIIAKKAPIRISFIGVLGKMGLIGVASDITERKHAEKELVESKQKAESANKLKDAVRAVTAHAFEEDKQKAFEVGCDSYLAKPFSKESLLNMMADYVDRYQSEKVL
jgi:hypothetical protein